MNTNYLPSTFSFFFLCFIAFQSIAQTLSDGLLGHYPCSHTDLTRMVLRDISIFKNHGSLHGNVTPEPDPSRSDNYALGAGVSSSIFVNKDYDNVRFEEIPALSIAFWLMELTNTSQCIDNCTPLLNIEDENGNRYELFLNKYRELTLVNSNNGATFFNLKENQYRTTEFNSWNHVAFSIDAVGQKAEVYINGRLAGNLDNRFMLAPEGPRFSFGLNHDNRYFADRFCVDEIRIYNRILKNKEVAELAENPLSSTKYLNNSADALSVYPNPSTTGAIQWEGVDLSEIARLQVLDFTGKIILTEETPSDNQLQLPAHARGNLLLSIIRKDGSSQCRSFICLDASK